MITKLENNYSYLIPLLFIFPLLRENLISFTVILLTINTIVYCVLNKKFILNAKVMVFTIPFWIILINNLLDFENINGFLPAKNAILFLIIPVLFANIPESNFSEKKVNFYFKILQYTLFVIAITYYCSFFYYYDFKDLFVYKYKIPKFRDFIYNEVPFFKIHPTYYTSITIFSIAHSFDRLINYKNKLELFFIAFFSFTIVIFLAKLNIVFLAIMLMYFIFFKLQISKKYKSIIIISLVMFSISSLNYIPGIKNRFLEMTTSYQKAPTGMAYDSTNIRVSIIECSIELVKNNFWSGIGYSKIENRLLECYSSNYKSDFYKNKKYLTHNYFMYIVLGGGVFALLIYLLYVYAVFLKIKSIGSITFTIAMINIFLVNFTEDFFFRQKGLFYFSLLFFTYLKVKNEFVNNRLDIVKEQ